MSPRIPGYIAESWLMAVIEFHALATIRRHRRLSGQHAVENGTTARTTKQLEEIPA
jgi:hypothetical protein